MTRCASTALVLLIELIALGLSSGAVDDTLVASLWPRLSPLSTPWRDVLCCLPLLRNWRRANTTSTDPEGRAPVGMTMSRTTLAHVRRLGMDQSARAATARQQHRRCLREQRRQRRQQDRLIRAALLPQLRDALRVLLGWRVHRT